jgi:hypothetical protein
MYKIFCVALVVFLLGCSESDEDAKTQFEESFETSFKSSFIKSCVESSAEEFSQGCACVADDLLDHFEINELAWNNPEVMEYAVNVSSPKCGLPTQ